MMKRIGILVFIGLIVFACKKTEDRSCFKAVGGLTTKTIALSSFDKLYMGPHLKYVLIQDTEDKVVLIGGKNLLNFIETSVEDSKLSIRNKNKCNFLRSYDKMVTVEIHFKKIINVLFEGSEEVEARNKITTDYLTVVLNDGAGKFNLDVNCLALNVIANHGWCNYSLKGNTNYFGLDVRSNGFGESYGLNVNDSIIVVSNTTNLVEINADNCLLRAQTNESGEIWYKGFPTFIEEINYGEGRLVNKN